MFSIISSTRSNDTPEQAESPSRERERRYQKYLFDKRTTLAERQVLAREESRVAELLQARMAAEPAGAAQARPRPGRSQDDAPCPQPAPAPRSGRPGLAFRQERPGQPGRHPETPRPAAHSAPPRAEHGPAAPEGGRAGDKAVPADPARALQHSLRAGFDRILADAHGLPGRDTEGGLEDVLARLSQLDIAAPRRWLREVRQFQGEAAWQAQRERMDGSFEFFRAFCAALPDGARDKPALMEQLDRLQAGILEARGPSESAEAAPPEKPVEAKEPAAAKPDAAGKPAAPAPGAEAPATGPDRQAADETALREYLHALDDLAQSLAAAGPGVPQVLQCLGQFRQHLRGKEAPETTLARLCAADQAGGDVFRADIGAALDKLERIWAALPPDHAAKALLRKKLDAEMARFASSGERRLADGGQERQMAIQAVERDTQQRREDTPLLLNLAKL